MKLARGISENRMTSEGKRLKDNRGSNSSSIQSTLSFLGVLYTASYMRMLKLASGIATTMDGAADKLVFTNGIQNLSCQRVSRWYIQIPYLRLGSLALTNKSSSSLGPTLKRVASKQRESVKVYARRRRSNVKTGTYVLLEPGKNEEFVSEEELRDRLKGWLDNWPGQALPPDLAKFENTDDAVTHLVKYVCELEIDGDVGSIQWFEVRLE